jgi:hypothetical protein
VCGRYYSLFDKQQAAEHFHVRRTADNVGIIAPNYNVAPGDLQPVIRRSRDGIDDRGGDPRPRWTYFTVGTSMLNLTAKVRRDISSDLHTTRNAFKVAEKHGIPDETLASPRELRSQRACREKGALPVRFGFKFCRQVIKQLAR